MKRTKIYLILTVLILALCQSVLADNATPVQMGVATPTFTQTSEASNITPQTTTPVTSGATITTVMSVTSPTMTVPATTPTVTMTATATPGPQGASFTFKINDVITNGNELYAV